MPEELKVEPPAQLDAPLPVSDPQLTQMKVDPMQVDSPVPASDPRLEAPNGVATSSASPSVTAMEMTSTPDMTAPMETQPAPPTSVPATSVPDSSTPRGEGDPAAQVPATMEVTGAADATTVMSDTPMAPAAEASNHVEPATDSATVATVVDTTPTALGSEVPAGVGATPTAGGITLEDDDEADSQAANTAIVGANGHDLMEPETAAPPTADDIFMDATEGTSDATPGASDLAPTPSTASAAHSEAYEAAKTARDENIALRHELAVKMNVITPCLLCDTDMGCRRFTKRSFRLTRSKSILNESGGLLISCLADVSLLCIGCMLLELQINTSLLDLHGWLHRVASDY